MDRQQKLILGVLLPVLYLAGRRRGHKLVESVVETTGNPDRAEFLRLIRQCKDEGMSEAQIAKEVGVSVTDFRMVHHAAKHAEAEHLHNQGLAVADVARKLGIDTSNYRVILAVENKIDTDHEY